MRFQLRQRFAHPAATINETYADPALYPNLVGLPKLGGIEVIAHERADGIARLSIRIAFTGDLPTAVTAVVDPARLTWVQESEHDLSTGVTRFRMVPDHYPDRLSSSGTATIRGTGDTCERVVAGELKVKAPLVAGRVERAIVGGLEEYLVAEAPAVESYLAAGEV